MGSDGLIIDGHRYPVPGVRVVTWLDDPDAAPLVTKGFARSASAVTAIVLHTSRGRRGGVRPVAGSDEKALRLARYQARGSRAASWHLTIGGAGTVYQQADLATFATWHASHANQWSVGVELAQSADTPDLTRAQVDACVAVVRVICAAMKIPERFPAKPGNVPIDGPVRAWQSRKQGGESLSARGVIGHRNLTTSRGPGDPGDAVFTALAAVGFVGVAPPVITGALDAGSPMPGNLAADADEPHDDEPPAWPPLPSWVDPALEVDASRDLPDDLAAFVRAQAPHLAALGVTGDRAAELLAHAATECGRGRRAHGNNYFGAKIRERDDKAHREKHGRGLGWWRDFGHVESGDDEVELYRAFDSPADAWRWFVWRHVGRPDEAPSSERYAATGRAFWSETPARWFPALLAAGYRGDRRAAEVRAQGDAHPSVVSHRALVTRVRGML